MLRIYNEMAQKDEIMQTETEMRSCPFCGGDAEVIFEGPKYYYPACSVCPVELHEIYFTPEEAAEAWNRRAD